tara:strand:+ start:102 stop:380 length:279 start_codon:yes stop_codon:yes gene_type:complete
MMSLLPAGMELALAPLMDAHCFAIKYYQMRRRSMVSKHFPILFPQTAVSDCLQRFVLIKIQQMEVVEIGSKIYFEEFQSLLSSPTQDQEVVP